MTRLRLRAHCLEAQVQQQIAQSRNAELAVPCPDCGVESGRACRDSLDRAACTHLARSVAANRRDTEPCPAPGRLEQIQELNAAQESLTRAAAREFYEQVAASAAKAIGETQRPLKWLETADHGPDAIWFGIDPAASDGDSTARATYRSETPTASDCAPSPAASAPEAAYIGVAPSRGDSGRPDRCANCSQPLGYGTKILGNVVIGWHCGDCWSSVNLWDPEQSRTLDQRIREAQPDEPHHCAWSTPTSDGEGWR